jgi:AraC family transcriptional regulator
MTRDSIVTTAQLHNRPAGVELLPRSAYETAYTAAVGTIGFAFETQRGLHALGSDRRVPFYTRPNTLAYLPVGCDVYSQSSGGGEYLHIRLPDWTPANARQINDVLAPQAIWAAHAIRCALLTAPDHADALEHPIAVLAEAVSGAFTPERAEMPRSRSITHRRLKLIDDLIEERMQERLTVADLAAALGLSVGFLIRAFRAETGVTPHAYIMDRRVSRARQLLCASTTSLAGVAAACGFASQAHLATVFKRRFAAGCVLRR